MYANLIPRLRLAVTSLLVLSTFIASAVSINLFTPVMATPSISLLPTSGPPGTEVFFSGSGYSTSDTICSVTSYGSGGPGSSGFISKTACAVTIVSGATSYSLTGGFIVATNGQYTNCPCVTVVRVTGISGGDYAETKFVWP